MTLNDAPREGAAGGMPGASEVHSLNPDPLFNQAEAAYYLHSSAPTLERNRHFGIGPKFVKMGGIVRYRRSDLDAYIDACTRLPRGRGRRGAVA